MTQEAARRAAESVATVQTEQAVLAEAALFGDALRRVAVEPGPGAPTAMWQSRHLIVALYVERGGMRLTVQRVSDSILVRPENRSGRPLSWEELQEAKSEAGFGGVWAVEIYPPDRDAVNVNDLRHLWVVPESTLPFAWRSAEGEDFYRKA